MSASTELLDPPVSRRDAPVVPTATVRPSRAAGPLAAPPVRTLGGVTRGDVLTLGGALGSAVCTSLLIFGRLAPLTGAIGFVVVTYLVFLALYALLIWTSEERLAVIDKLMTVVFASAAGLAGTALFSVVTFTLWRGRAALTRVNLYWRDMSEAGPADPLSVGGIAHAIVGTLLMLAVALLITVPLGLACAVFLNETRSRAAGLVRTVVNAMTALPSVLAGLFIFATWILILGFERSSLAASLAISIMMLPIIIRSSDVVLRLVPGNLREAGAALGAPTWRSVAHVVLPTARSGLATSIILGVARGVGETSPVLLTAGFTATMNADPMHGPMVSLPLAAFEFVQSPEPAMVARGFATAAVLMIVVLVLFAIARVVGGRPAGRVSGRQARRLAARSARDAERFALRGGGAA